jgi:hypothetical protein
MAAGRIYGKRDAQVDPSRGLSGCGYGRLVIRSTV